MYKYPRKCKIRASPRALYDVRSCSPISDISRPIMSIALQLELTFIEMSCEASWHVNPFQVPVGLGFFALLKLGQCPQPPKLDANWMEENRTAISSSLTLIPCRTSPSPLKHTTMLWQADGHFLVLQSPTPNRGQGCFGMAWKQTSAQVHSCGMLGIPTWDEALGTAVSTASTLISQMLLSQLVSPAHDEREFCVISPHTQEWDMHCSWHTAGGHNPCLWICLYLLKPSMAEWRTNAFQTDILSPLGK